MIKGAPEDNGFEKVNDLVEIAGSLQPLAAVMSGGERVEDLLLVESARDHGIIRRIVLVGRKQLISDAVAKVGIDVPTKDILAAQSDEEAAAITAGLLRDGVAQMVLKGSTPTHILHRHMLPLAVRNTVSLVSIFDAAPLANGRPIILTDAGINTVCSYARIAGVIRNAVDVARHVMQIDTPRVALLSATEKELPSIPSTQLGAAFARQEWPDAIVYGPLSLDLATDPRAVASKKLLSQGQSRVSEVAGKADILVCPNIETGNVIYKMVSALIKYGEASLANIIMGFPKPYVLLSRSDALETRLNSLALGAIYAQRGLGEHAAPCRVLSRKKIKTHRIVVVNPGSTSTKIALFENDLCVRDVELQYLIPTAATPQERRRQTDELAQRVREVLREAKWRKVDAIAARGGFVPRPSEKVSGGTYIIAGKRNGKIVVNKALVNAMLEHPEKQHASNLGIPVAAVLADALKAPAYFTDPVVVDEFIPEAEISGFNGITRCSKAHALSVRAAMRKAAKELGRSGEDVNLVVAHLGGGVTIAAINNGRMIDNNIALLGGGPFTPQRAGQLPVSELIDMCYSGRFTRDEMYEQLTKHGGLQSYLDEYRLDVIENRIQKGDEYARLVVDAMIYQIAKEIGAMYVAAGCDAEAIVLTGGMVRAGRVRNGLRKRIGRLAPVLVFEQSLEMEALAAGALHVLTGECKPKVLSNA
ncbi:MAG TPA: butyrate kinase [Candidatus Hydrogenedentes bacterium]|nr:butyrate kinase [Candidatus Hydrogenedentota bacterium]